MDRPVIRAAGLGCALAIVPMGAVAHQLTVFASVDCENVFVEAKFSNGKAVQLAEVRVLDGDSVVLLTQPIMDDGTLTVPLDNVDHSGGLVIEVDTGSHDNYWIVTPDDITRNCEK